MDVREYIKPEMLVLVPVLYVVGMILKRTERVDNRLIPAVLGISGIIFALIWTISTEGFSGVGVFTGITQGILVAGAAVYVNQLIKQAKKDKEGSGDE